MKAKDDNRLILFLLGRSQNHKRHFTKFNTSQGANPFNRIIATRLAYMNENADNQYTKATSACERGSQNHTSGLNDECY